MSEKISLDIKNRIEEIPRLHRAAERFSREHDLPASTLNAVKVALDEMLTNIISYGYTDDDEHSIAVSVTLLRGDRLRIAIEDDGRPFNPLDAEAPDTDSPLQERPVGGLGIHLVRQLMDSVEYRRLNHRNLLVLEKQIPDHE